MSRNPFKERIAPFRHKLYRFALSLVGEAAEAEDVVQEVLIKLWRQWSEIDAIDNLEAWSMRLTKNQSLDRLRSRRRRTGDLDGAAAVAGDAPTPYEVVAAGDTIGRVRQLMEQLPDNQRLVMHLRDIEGLSYQEISETLDMPMTQVKINLFRARRQVREYLIKSNFYEK